MDRKKKKREIEEFWRTGSQERQRNAGAVERFDESSPLKTKAVAREGLRYNVFLESTWSLNLNGKKKRASLTFDRGKSKSEPLHLPVVIPRWKVIRGGKRQSLKKLFFKSWLKRRRKTEDLRNTLKGSKMSSSRGKGKHGNHYFSRGGRNFEAVV